MTVTSNTFTQIRPNTNVTSNYHYLQYNGVPNYYYLGQNNQEYIDWQTIADNFAGNVGFTNTAKIGAQDYAACVPETPTFGTSCAAVNGLVGIMINGAPLWTWETSSKGNAVEDVAKDVCNGHPNKDNKYHFHGVSLLLF